MRARHSATGRRPRNMARAIQILFLLQYFLFVHTEVLTPRYFNLASKKKITATATCGDEGPELYCKLVGANADHNEHVIQGQVSVYILIYAASRMRSRGYDYPFLPQIEQKQV